MVEVVTIEGYIGRYLIIIIGVILVLAGIFNWKFILFINYRAETLIELFGLKFYRAIYILVGLFFITWMIVG